jgi:hypothetical protein
MSSSDHDPLARTVGFHNNNNNNTTSHGTDINNSTSSCLP